MLDRVVVHGQGHALWLRPVYMAGFQAKQITAVVRPGDRSDPKSPTGFLVGEDLAARFIQKAGDPAKKVAPEFFPDDGTTVRVKECIVKKIRELTPADLTGTAPDTATPELVRYHLATIYNTELPKDDDVVTIWRFEYRPNVTE